MIYLAVAVAGALGASARLLADRTISHGRRDPAWGIVAVNVSGSFALGILAGLVRHHDLDLDVATVAGAGFLGAFTTFSTFTLDALRLGDRRAVVYVATSVIGGVGAAALGLALAAA